MDAVNPEKKRRGRPRTNPLQLAVGVPPRPKQVTRRKEATESSVTTSKSRPFIDISSIDMMEKDSDNDSDRDPSMTAMDILESHTGEQSSSDSEDVPSPVRPSSTEPRTRASVVLENFSGGDDDEEEDGEEEDEDEEDEETTKSNKRTKTTKRKVAVKPTSSKKRKTNAEKEEEEEEYMGDFEEVEFVLQFYDEHGKTLNMKRNNDSKKSKPYSYELCSDRGIKGPLKLIPDEFRSFVKDPVISNALDSVSAKFQPVVIGRVYVKPENDTDGSCEKRMLENLKVGNKTTPNNLKTLYTEYTSAGSIQLVSPVLLQDYEKPKTGKGKTTKPTPPFQFIPVTIPIIHKTKIVTYIPCILVQRDTRRSAAPNNNLILPVTTCREDDINIVAYMKSMLLSILRLELSIPYCKEAEFVLMCCVFGACEKYLVNSHLFSSSEYSAMLVENMTALTSTAKGRRGKASSPAANITFTSPGASDTINYLFEQRLKHLLLQHPAKSPAAQSPGNDLEIEPVELVSESIDITPRYSSSMMITPLLNGIDSDVGNGNMDGFIVHASNAIMTQIGKIQQPLLQFITNAQQVQLRQQESQERQQNALLEFLKESTRSQKTRDEDARRFMTTTMDRLETICTGIVDQHKNTAPISDRDISNIMNSLSNVP